MVKGKVTSNSDEQEGYEANRFMGHVVSSLVKH